MVVPSASGVPPPRATGSVMSGPSAPSSRAAKLTSTMSAGRGDDDLLRGHRGDGEACLMHRALRQAFDRDAIVARQKLHVAAGRFDRAEQRGARGVEQGPAQRRGGNRHVGHHPRGKGDGHGVDDLRHRHEDGAAMPSVTVKAVW